MSAPSVRVPPVATLKFLMTAVVEADETEPRARFAFPRMSRIVPAARATAVLR